MITPVQAVQPFLCFLPGHGELVIGDICLSEFVSFGLLHDECG